MITCPKKSTLTTLIQFALVAAVAVALFTVLLPVFAAAHQDAVRHVQSRMADLGRSMAEYSEDYDGEYPSGTFAYVIGKRLSLTGLGWAGQLYPYVKTPADFDDALGSAGKDATMGSVVAYAINENVSRHAHNSQWGDRAKTVLLFQVTGARAQIDQPNEAGCNSDGPCSPSGNGTMIMLSDGLFPRRVSPATGNIGSRMLDTLIQPWPDPEIDGGAFYLLVDGHVAWFKPTNVSSGTDARHPEDAQHGTITGAAAGTLNTGYSATFSTR